MIESDEYYKSSRREFYKVILNIDKNLLKGPEEHYHLPASEIEFVY